MHVVEKSTNNTSQADDEVGGEFIRDSLLHWLRNAVAVLHEEVPKEEWPRVAARLDAAGVLPMSDDDLAKVSEEPVKGAPRSAHDRT
jgi:hypothetical protein